MLALNILQYYQSFAEYFKDNCKKKVGKPLGAVVVLVSCGIIVVNKTGNLSENSRAIVKLGNYCGNPGKPHLFANH